MPIISSKISSLKCLSKLAGNATIYDIRRYIQKIITIENQQIDVIHFVL